MLIIIISLVTRQLKPNTDFQLKSSKLELSRFVTFHKSDRTYNGGVIALIEDIFSHATVETKIQKQT